MLIVPLKLDEQTFGLFELASFTSIPAFQVKWLEEMGEQVAVKITRLHHESELSHLLEKTRDKINILQEENARLQRK